MSRVAKLEVIVHGAPIAGTVRAVRVASRLARPAQCEVSVDGEPVPLGAALRVLVGGEELFDGEVTAVELVREADGTAGTRLRAYDRLHRLRKRGRPRVHAQVTVADLAAALVADLGLAGVDGGPGQRAERIVQHGQRDFDLLVEAAAAEGLYPVLRDGRLHLVDLAGDGAPPVPLRYGESLWHARVEANVDRAATRYTALGWHPQRAEPLTATVTAARSGRLVAWDAVPATVGVDGDLTLVNQPGVELAGLAQAALDSSAAGAVTVSGTADGDPRLWAGRRIDLSGVTGDADGRYVLTEAVHLVDAAGYRTEFTTRPPERPKGRSGTELTLGRVTAVDDPDGLGRVRVSLPAHGDVDAGWLAVLCPGAGKGRGLVVLPDVDDTVAVALPYGLPVAGMVLGSLFGAVAPVDSGVRDGAVRAFSLHTAGGQSIAVDDVRKSVRLANDDGSYVELAPGKVRLHAETDLVIDAPGHGITVRAKTIDFEHAPVPVPLDGA